MIEIQNKAMSEVVAAALRAGDRIVVTNADGEEKAITSLADYEQAYGDREVVVQDDGLVLLTDDEGSSDELEITRRVYPQRFADIGDVISPEVFVTQWKITFCLDDETAIVLSHYPIKEGDEPRWHRQLTQKDVFAKHGYSPEFVEDVLSGVDTWMDKVNTRCVLASRHPEYFVGITEEDKDNRVLIISDARKDELAPTLREEIEDWFERRLTEDQSRFDSRHSYND